MAETILLEVKLDSDQAQLNIEKTTKSIESLKKENSDLLKQQKELQKQGKQNGKQFQENAQKIAKNRSELTSLNKARVNSIKTLKAEANSMDALKAKLAQDVAARNKVNTATKEGQVRFNAFNKAILKTTKALSKAEEAGGNFGRGVGNYSKGLKRVSKLASQFGLILGAGALFSGLKKSIELFGVQAEAELRLEEAIGGNIDAYKLEATALQNRTTFGDEQILQAQAQLAVLGLTEEQIKKLTPLVLDLSASTGKDLTKSTKEVVSALATGSTTLEKYGVELSATNTQSENFDKTIAGLKKSVGGTSEAIAKVGTGPLKQMQNRFGDILEIVGEKLVPVLNFVAENFDTIAKVVGIAAGAFLAYKVVQTASTIATNVLALATKALNAVMNASPLGLFITLAAGLAVAFFGLSGEIDAAEDRLDDFNESTQEAVKLSDKRIAQIDEEIRSLKRQGAAEGAIIDARLRRNDEQIKRQKELIKASEDQAEKIQVLNDILGFEAKALEGVQAEIEKLNGLQQERLDIQFELNDEEKKSQGLAAKASLEDIVNIIKVRLTKVAEGTAQELALRKQLIAAQRSLALDNEKLIASERALIVAESNRDILELDKDFREDQLRQVRDAEIGALKAADAGRKLNEEKIQRRFDRDLKKFKRAQAQQNLALTKSLQAEEISRDEFADMREQNLINSLMNEITIREKFGKETIDLEQRLADETLKISQKAAADEEKFQRDAKDNEDKISEDQRLKKAEAFQASIDFLQDTVTRFNEALVESAQTDLDNFTRAEDKKTSVLEKQLSSGLISQEKFDSEKEKLAAERLKLEEKVFKRQKAADISQAIINTFQSAIAAYKSLVGIPFVGPILAPIAAGAATAFGLSRVASIKKQKFAMGGKVSTAKGNTHSTGGVKYYGSDGNVIEVEGNENLYVLKKTASNEINSLSNLNQSHGGVSFSAPSVTFAQQGGRIATSQNVSTTEGNAQQEASFRQILSELPTPVVTVADINSGQNRVNVAEQRANQ